MDNANKIISFVLGLVVVIVFILLITGKLSVGKKLQTLFKAKVTPTVTPSATPTPQADKKITINYPNAKTGTSNTYQANGSNQIAGKNLSNIPNTGAPTFLLPFAFSVLAGGTFLRKTGKKN
jgi:hypothetical protein